MAFIPKKIHVAWKSKALLNENSIFVDKCAKSLSRMSPTWDFLISDDDDIDQYLRINLDIYDYGLLKGKHIVEKSDVWRLIKLYNDGGLYVDIDRMCNKNLDDIVLDTTKVVLPTCGNFDFSHDFMCSAPNNPMMYEVLELNLRRRRAGHTNIYYLGPQTYFHGVTKSLFGEMIDVNPGDDVFSDIRNCIINSGFISTYTEHPPYDTILYNVKNDLAPIDHESEKRKFYRANGMHHWTGEW